MSIGEEGSRRRQQGPALCRHYLTARFALIEARPIEAHGFSPRSIMWALGTHLDGQHDPLGAWPTRAEEGCAWTHVLGDLWERGIERIDWAILPGDEAAPVGRRAGWPIIGHWLNGLPSATPSVPPSTRMRNLLASADEVCMRLQSSLSRASRRRGGQFESVEAAEDCLRRLWQKQSRSPEAEHAARSRVITSPLARVPVSLGTRVSAQAI